MVLIKCLFGSRLYGSYSTSSDYDYIIVEDVLSKQPNINEHHYTKESFIQAVKNGDINCLEVYYADKKYFEINNWQIPLIEVDKEQFRRNISMLTSNSWVKGKKKLIVLGDYDLNIGLKSIFHSVRILDFAIQISVNGKITNYSSMNWLLTDLYKLSEIYERQELWDKINEKYRELFNKKSSEFKKLNPIQKTKESEILIKNTLLKYDVFNVDLYNELKLLLR